MIKIGGMCFSWKVLAGLAGVAVAIVALNPGLFANALPVLIALACPLSMIFMMGGHGRHAGDGGQVQQTENGLAATLPTDAASCHESVQTDRPAALPSPAQTPIPPARELVVPSLADLKSELAQLEERHAVLARRIAALDTEEPLAVREARAVARAAETR